MKRMASPARRSKNRSKRPRAAGVVAIVRKARRAAARALEELRSQISETKDLLARLLAEERNFIEGLDARSSSSLATARGRKPAFRQPRRRAAPKADSFFRQLPKRFTLDDVRRKAGRLTGVSLAQWSRAKKIRKVGRTYVKQT